VPLNPQVLRATTMLSWRLRLQPTPPGWLDMALAVPVMDVRRAHEELGWRPVRSSVDAILDALAGLREDAGLPTAPLTGRAAPPPGRSRVARGA
jgi:hypothetical protein